MEIAEALERARALTQRADDEGAKEAYLDVWSGSDQYLRAQRTRDARFAGGFRSAARTAYLQAVRSIILGARSLTSILPMCCARTAIFRRLSCTIKRHSRSIRTCMRLIREWPRCSMSLISRERKSTAARISRPLLGHQTVSRHRHRGAALDVGLGTRGQYRDAAMDRRSVISRSTRSTPSSTIRIRRYRRMRWW